MDMRSRNTAIRRYFDWNLEQVHVRSLVCRALRLQLLAGFVIALSLAARGETTQPTHTSLQAETHDGRGLTQAQLAVSVAGEDGAAPAGSIAIEDNGKQVAGAALDAEGNARLSIDLAEGDHALSAVYLGDAVHAGSASDRLRVHANAVTVPDFTIAVAPATVSLPVGQSGTVITTITPVNASALSAPMFITISCSGLPSYSSCTFTPENIEILPNATKPLTSSMVIETQLGTTAQVKPPARQNANPIVWAFILPGALGLIGLAGRGRRDWLNRLSMLVLLGFVTILGTAACNPRYNYFNHGPPPNPPTPAGTYTLNVIAQSSNGITATTHSTTMTLTVQ
jgi:hypothetical protein